jgi:MFS family permease
MSGREYMPNSNDEQERAVASGIWQFIGDLGAIWFGYELLCLVGGLLVLAVVELCSLLFGLELGWTLGFWIVIVGGVVLAAFAAVSWRKQKVRRHRSRFGGNKQD